MFSLQVTHSPGNHAQALAWASTQAGIPCKVVVPRDTPQVKIDAIQGYGAEVVLCEPTLVARYSNIFFYFEKWGAF